MKKIAIAVVCLGFGATVQILWRVLPVKGQEVDGDPWDRRIQVVARDLGTMTLAGVDSDGRQLLYVVPRVYNGKFSEEVDGTRTEFTTPITFVSGTECVHVNGVRQAPGVGYTLLEEKGRSYGVRLSKSPQAFPEGTDLLTIDYDPVQ